MELVDQVFESDPVSHVGLHFNHLGQILDHLLEVYVVVVRNFEVVDKRRDQVELDSLGTGLSDFPDTGVMPRVVAHINRFQALVISFEISLALGLAEDLENIPQLSVHETIFVQGHEDALRF